MNNYIRFKTADGQLHHVKCIAPFTHESIEAMEIAGAHQGIQVCIDPVEPGEKANTMEELWLRALETAGITMQPTLCTTKPILPGSPT